jgi:DNA (cytosine-5)-methyltransferase 1
MAAFYNENNVYCIEWLRNLAAAGLMADGYVDGRDVRDIAGSDIAGRTQVHLFAGIGI